MAGEEKSLYFADEKTEVGRGQVVQLVVVQSVVSTKIASLSGNYCEKQTSVVEDKCCRGRREAYVKRQYL